MKGNSVEIASGSMMPIKYIRDAQTAHPTGDPSFAVKQCFPAVVPEQESDPFLMCDEFGPMKSKGAYGDDTDEGFDVPWHPHHGMDILSYIIEGRGRHADSLGNRETFDSPGFQWLSVGSGIEHAEGGGTPAGQHTHGFQLWLRMPKERMEDDPRYGTVGPEAIPLVTFDGGQARVVAGPLEETIGPAKFSVNVQILDIQMEPGAEWMYSLPESMDNAMFYCFQGGATLNGKEEFRFRQICRFDTSGASSVAVQAGPDGFRAMVLAGKMTREKVIWHGPFVCSSQANLRECFNKYRTGAFPPKRVSWDYRDIRKKPA